MRKVELTVLDSCTEFDSVADRLTRSRAAVKCDEQQQHCEAESLHGVFSGELMMLSCLRCVDWSSVITISQLLIYCFLICIFWKKNCWYLEQFSAFCWLKEGYMVGVAASLGGRKSVSVLDLLSISHLCRYSLWCYKCCVAEATVKTKLCKLPITSHWKKIKYSKPQN